MTAAPPPLTPVEVANAFALHGISMSERTSADLVEATLGNHELLVVGLSAYPRDLPAHHAQPAVSAAQKFARERILPRLSSAARGLTDHLGIAGEASTVELESLGLLGGSRELLGSGLAVAIEQHGTTLLRLAPVVAAAVAADGALR